MKRRHEFFAIAMAFSIGASTMAGTAFGSGLADHFSDAELEYYTDLLAHLIVGEVEGCDREMKEYVASVPVNRVNSASFPDSLEEVIYQPGQYSCTWDGNFEKTPTEEDYEIAEDILVNGSKLPEDVVFQAEFEQGSGIYTKLVAPNGVTEYFCYG
jgi:hypothetical protein